MDINTFYYQQTKPFFKKKNFVKMVLEYRAQLRVSNFLTKEEQFFSIFSTFIEEANVSFDLIKKDISKKRAILEVGGGIGLVYGYLKYRGYDITSIEPSAKGFGSYYQIGKEMLGSIGIDSSQYLSLVAEDGHRLKKKFDIIFSNNVLEHVNNLEAVIVSLRDLLKDDGIMVHKSPNYLFPYDPHFAIPLVPFFPRLTQIFYQRLYKSQLWNGLCFLTAFTIKRICKKNSLLVTFDNQILVQTLKRLEKDSNFASRHGFLKIIMSLFKSEKIINFCKIFPAEFVTPMGFTIRKIPPPS